MRNTTSCSIRRAFATLNGWTQPFFLCNLHSSQIRCFVFWTCPIHPRWCLFIWIILLYLNLDNIRLQPDVPLFSAAFPESVLLRQNWLPPLSSSIKYLQVYSCGIFTLHAGFVYAVLFPQKFLDFQWPAWQSSSLNTSSDVTSLWVLPWHQRQLKDSSRMPHWHTLLRLPTNMSSGKFLLVPASHAGVQLGREAGCMESHCRPVIYLTNVLPNV